MYYRKLILKILKLYADNFGKLLENPIKKSDLSRNSLPRLFSKAIRSQIETSITKRADDVCFYQLFNFRYADGAQMLTLGGIIDIPTQTKQLEESGIYS